MLGPGQEAWVWEAGGGDAGKVAGEGLRHGDGMKQDLDARSDARRDYFKEWLLYCSWFAVIGLAWVRARSPRLP